MLQSNSNILTTMNPLNSRDLLGKINKAVMSFSGKDILLVEGYNDEKLYKNHIVKGLGKTNIEVLPVYKKGYLLEDTDVELLGKVGDVSPKLSIILLVKRCYAREWAKGTLVNKFYGIVDKDFFFDEELEFVNDSLLYNPYSTSMTDEDWKAYFFDAVSNGRLVTTDTNDVETLIFTFDFEAVKKACRFASSTYNLDNIRENALKKACKKSSYQKEKNYNDGFYYNKDTLEFSSFSHIGWEYCKGHVFVNEFLSLVDNKKQHFKNEKMFLNAVMNYINVTHFEESKVYRFIESI